MFHDESYDPRTEGLLDLVDDLLTDEERWVVDAIVFDRRSYRTVASQMSRSVGYVWNVNRRALDKLKEALSERVRNGSDEGQ